MGSKVLYELLSKMHIVEDNQTDNFIDTYVLKASRAISIGFINQHGCNLVVDEQRVYRSFMDLTFLLRDGIGVKMACLKYGIKPGENLNGTDLIPRILDKVLGDEHNKSIVFGTKEPWLSKGVNRFFGNNNAHYLDGFRTNEEYLIFLSDYFKNDEYEEKKITVILLAMGMPKQEELANKILELCIDKRVIIICGGAIIDFAAGRFKRAPKFIQKIGLEWAYRLFCEPSRLFKRYAIGIPVFFYNMMTNK